MKITLPKREIKFRAWDNINKVMFTPTKIDFENRYVEYHIDGRVRVLDIDNEVILMQYTGLKDKNDKEIYEGDILEIVKDNSVEDEHNFGFKRGEILIVIWCDDGFKLTKEIAESDLVCQRCLVEYDGLYTPNHEIEIGFFSEVVGNVFEHGYLLEVEKNKNV